MSQSGSTIAGRPRQVYYFHCTRATLISMEEGTSLVWRKAPHLYGGSQKLLCRKSKISMQEGSNPDNSNEYLLLRGLFGIRLLILHFKFQFSKSIKSSTFHIFLNLTYPLRKNISFPKCPKIAQKFTQNRQTVVNEKSREI